MRGARRIWTDTGGLLALAILAAVAATVVAVAADAPPAARSAATPSAAATVPAAAGMLAPAAVTPPPAVAAGAGGDVLRKGRYLARAGDCIGCHTAQGGRDYAGGRAIPTPFGTLYAPNITPDPETGIGGWSADDFWQAMHAGEGPHGRLLYPAFPFPSYTRVTRDDVDAIYAWLQHGVTPVKRENRPPALSFPYNLRSLMAVWRLLYFDQGVYTPDPKKSAQWNRGAYLVRGLGHCAGCHAPRNRFGAIGDPAQLVGAMIPMQGWYAPDLGTGPGGALDGWSEQDLVDLLHTGRSARGTAYGPMAEVVQQSLQYLSETDVRAMATYLLARPSQPRPADVVGVVPPRHLAVQLASEGKAIYGKRCAACHGDDGRGKGIYPPLDGNTSLLAADPVNVVRVVLLGGFEPTTASNPRPYSMPSFVQELDDREVAAVATYVRQAWGNDAAAVAPEIVRQYRSTPAR
ncbi:MAG TPA: cytochrome c [Rhodanobacteraceae bacterium]|nr:cytochrome c [Rhodanobacteraceae bacterium]